MIRPIIKPIVRSNVPNQGLSTGPPTQQVVTAVIKPPTIRPVKPLEEKKSISQQTPVKINISSSVQQLKLPVVTVATVLSQIKNDNGQFILTREQADIINNTLLFSLNESQILFQLIGLIVNYGFENTMIFINEKKSEISLSHYFQFENPGVKESRTKALLERESMSIGPEAEEGAFQCKRCKGWRTSYTERQLRSGDEPSTKFILCLKCGNRWKE